MSEAVALAGDAPRLGARSRPWPTTRVAALVYLLMACGLLHESVFAGRAFFYRDVLLFWLPSVEGIVRAIAGGEWPLWDPHIGFGKPILADPSEQAAYPPTWLNMLMHPATYYVVYLVAHLVWAGLGVRQLALQRGLPPLSAFAAGAVWCWSGPFVSAFSLLHHYAGIAWMPWVLVALEHLLERPGPGRGALLGLAAAAQTLAGSADLCLMAGLLAVLRLAWCWRQRGSWLLVRALAASALVAAGVAAVQWLPTLETIPGSGRTVYSASRFTFWSLHPGSLFDFLLPLPVGGLSLTSAVRDILYDGREPFVSSLYLGLGAACFAGMGLLAPLTGGRRQLRRELLLAGAVLLLLALGRHAPAYSWLKHLPGFSLIRYPVKFTFAGSLVCALAVGLGFSVWEDAWDGPVKRRMRALVLTQLGLALSMLLGALALERRPDILDGLVQSWVLREAADYLMFALAAGGLVLLAALWLLSRRVRVERPPVWLNAAALGLALLDLGGSALLLNPTAPSVLLTHWPSLLRSLATAPGPVRLQVLVPPESWLAQHLTSAPLGWTGETAAALGQFQLLVPPLPARWGVDGSYSGEFTGQERIFDTAMSVMARSTLGSPLGARLLQMAGVTHVVAIEENPYPDLELVEELKSVYDIPIRLSRVQGSLPRVYAVSGVDVAAEPESYAALAQASFDPRASVILPEGTPRPPSTGFESEVKLLWRHTASVGVEARLSGAGVVVLLDGWYPGWTVTVDGVDAPLLRANILFRGVAVPAGRHRIEFRYRPRGATWGARATLSTLVVLAIGAAVTRWRRGA